MFEDVDEAHAEGEEKMVFRYNREERIAKAPRIVQEYYAGGMRPITGFKVLVANKSNRYVLIALIFFVAATWLFTGLNKTRAYGKLGNISLELQGFSYGEEVFVTLKLLDRDANESSAPVKVDVEFHLLGPENQVMEKENLSMVYRNGEQYFRTKHTDYDIIRVEAIVTSGEQEKKLSADVKR